MKKNLVLIVLVLVALIVSGCAKNYSTELTVDLKEFMFEPVEYSIPAGQEITLNLTNSGTVVHEFVILNLGETVTIPFSDDDEGKIYWEHEVEPGKSASVTFTAPSEPGEYEVVCGTAGHLENGMKAKLTVVKP